MSWLAGLILLLQLGSWPVQTEYPSYLLALKTYLENQQFEDYLNLYSPELRVKEKENLAEYFGPSGFDSVHVRPAGLSQDSSGRNRAFFQVLFQNQYSASIEIWQITYELRPFGLVIIDKIVSGRVSQLYRLRFPGKSDFLASNLSFTEQDLIITFSRAHVFLDNLPETNTALIIIGEGRAVFRPSDEIERNQLRRRFKKPYWEKKLSSIYVRAAPGFFNDNLKYEIYDGNQPAAVRQNDERLVASIFARNYPRSFTVENSITGELLTFLPQSGETVIEMQAGRKDEFTYVYSPFAQEAVVFMDRGRGLLLSSYSPSSQAPELKMMYVRFEEKYEIENYQLEVSYNPDNNWMAGWAEISFLPLMEELDGVQFRLNPELQVRQIIDDRNRQLFYSRDRMRKLLYIYLAEEAKKGQHTSVKILYEGRIVPPPPLTDVLDFQLRPDFYSRDSLLYDSYLFTQSSEWYPAPASETYFTFSLKLFVPDNYYGLASGQLVAKEPIRNEVRIPEQNRLGKYLYKYVSQKPVKYVSFLVGQLRPGPKISGKVKLELFVSRGRLVDDTSDLAEAGKILEYYESLFGDFPYDQLAIVQRFWPTEGGVSPPGYIVLNEHPSAEGIPPIRIKPDNPVDLSFWSGYFLAHEIAHQWWGHGLSYATYRDNWLTEGLSQFSAMLYLQKKYGQKELEEIQKRISRWVRKKSDLGPIILGPRLSYLDFAGYQAIVYDKAALVLFMLKDLLGEDVFFKGLRNFYQSNLFRPARTADFQRSLEEASGLDLKQFFKDWFYSEALPEVKVKKIIPVDLDKTRPELQVRQINRPFFFPLKIIVETDRGRFVENIIVQNKEQVFHLDFPGRLKRLEVNPGDQVPGKIEIN
ncbi:MAG: hypothetical protein KA522_03200 [Candidatus Saccharicenans sp.]|nr:hypothetical protein [Candidatus Saccharicenans sp.]